MKRWLLLRRLASLVLMALAVYFVGRTLFELSGSISARDVMPGALALTGAAILSLAWVSSMACGWLWMLRFHSAAPRLPAVHHSFAAFMHAFISRYVPGKVWPAVILCERLHDDLPAAPIVRSYLLQQLHLLAGAGVLSVGILPLLMSDPDQQRWLYGLSMALAFALGLAWASMPQPFFCAGASIAAEKVARTSRFSWAGRSLGRRLRHFPGGGRFPRCRIDPDLAGHCRARAIAVAP